LVLISGEAIPPKNRKLEESKYDFEWADYTPTSRTSTNIKSTVQNSLAGFAQKSTIPPTAVGGVFRSNLQEH